MPDNARPEPGLSYNAAVFPHPWGEGDGGGQVPAVRAQTSHQVWAFLSTKAIRARRSAT
jgi:hypothetical protein